MRILAQKQQVPQPTQIPHFAKLNHPDFVKGQAANSISHLQRSIGNSALQAKLTYGSPGDRYEQEADRVADQVMRMPNSHIRGKCDCGGSCSGCQNEERTNIRGKSQARPLQTQRVQESGSHGAEVPSDVHSVLRSPGQPLDSASRSFMESRFGYDFSHVRVHNDTQANASAKGLSAKAYTVGNHLAFGSEHYAPNTSKGRRLLAHELSHVIQQGAAQPGPTNAQGSNPGLSQVPSASTVDPSVPSRNPVQLSSIGSHHLQRNPDVDFVVHKLERKENGKLGDPDQSTPEEVSWPLDFSVTSPLDATAEVEVTGGAGDNCSAFELGFLQTVHSQSLEIDYLGQRSQDGSTKRKWTVDLPIRDGEAGSMWYESSQNATASACGERVNPGIGDYPTIFSLNKRHVNSKTNQYNHLASVKRTMGFITTLVASGGGNVRPLRYFLWSYQMAGTFRPDYADATVEWPFTWIENSTTLKDVQVVSGSTVPYSLFTTATDVYNESLTEEVIEKS